MYSTLEVDIQPGVGLGMFQLGSSLWNVIDLLRRMQHAFPLVDVKFDPDFPVAPVILHIRPHVDLLFSGRHQRLHTICVRKLRDLNPPVSLKYKEMTLSSSEEVLRRVGVSRTFGPTYPGDDLRYPGVLFSFEEDGRAEGLKVSPAQPSDRMQEVKRVIITQKSIAGEVRDALDEVVECTAMNGEVRQAVIKVHEGVDLYFHPVDANYVRIRIGVSTAQDLSCDLGPPLRVHYKEDDRMTIHSRKAGVDDDADTDYFYNYLQHGIDFLISGTTHVVKKIVAHTNVPGSPLFQRYKRCPWEIEGKPEDDEDETPPRVKFHDRVEEISHFLSQGEPPSSMLLDRTDEEDNLTLPSSKTRLLGFDGIILEATESGHVVSVTLF
ncbi:UPF0183-domain-containing protein [Laetiporus sulphureus 93-53]|uniref:UPF0183-domain-containing protein n=1 Tax=Laetiporus sulphureus 93-53 TaxID=1314785 RepID=A0A165I2I7_9APHY|nr:UPF0183-domain-containing protein [Laetiporus sulphureus 93-53]KZT12505.1 UPF0183-domain-containing protein [Laetiporus sulphureus 93-53]